MPPVVVSLYPLDDRFALLTNFLWSNDENGNPTLSKEHMWVQFPEKLVITGVEVMVSQPLGDVTFETSLDYKNGWTLLKKADMSKPESGKPLLIEWEPYLADNLRIVVDRPEAAAFSARPLFSIFDLCGCVARMRVRPIGKREEGRRSFHWCDGRSTFMRRSPAHAGST